jgi:hypothetical protein
MFHPATAMNRPSVSPLFAFCTVPIGTSLAVSRLSTLLCYIVFLPLAYRLVKRLYSPWLAAFMVALLALGSQRVLQYQMQTYGGRPEGRPIVLALMLLALMLASGDAVPAGRRWRAWRLVGFAAWGFLAGLSLWGTG